MNINRPPLCNCFSGLCLIPDGTDASNDPQRHAYIGLGRDAAGAVYPVARRHQVPLDLSHNSVLCEINSLYLTTEARHENPNPCDSRSGSARNNRHLLHTYLFWYFWVGAIGGAAPDLFEPPTTRFHRNFFHSKIMVIIMVVVTLIAWAKTGGTSNDAYFVMAFGMGYVSHLLMDSRTYMGLP